MQEGAIIRYHYVCVKNGFSLSSIKSIVWSIIPDPKFENFLVGIHITRGQIFGNFDPPPPTLWSNMVIWPTPL